MTVVALIVGRYVSWCFPGRLYAVVAVGAAAGQRRVVHECNRIPVRRYVAIRAFANGCDVIGRF